MPRSVAVNVGANTNQPGVRGPVYPDGSFEFVPIPETAPTAEPAPTYRDLALDTAVPEPDQSVHLDPEFRTYPCGERDTYGDPWGVKARPLLDLERGDYAFFYATLEPRPFPDDHPRADGGGDAPAGEPDAPAGEHPEWVPPDWGAFLVGVLRLARDPVAGEAYHDLPPGERAAFANNAHVRRAEFDAAVLLAGDPDASGLFARAVALSGARGADAGDLVALSADSGEGPWWRRPLRYDAAATETLLDRMGGRPPLRRN